MDPESETSEPQEQVIEVDHDHKPATDKRSDDAFSFPIWKPVRRKHLPDSPFFASGNLERELLAKQVVLEITEEEKLHLRSLEEQQCWTMVCPVVGCKTRLKGLKDLETHFFSRHTATCSVCSRVFPTSRLLDIHVAETHDSFFKAKAARGHSVYACLVEGCDMKFQSDFARHQHLVDKHKFPKSYEFHKRRHPSQKQRRRMHTRSHQKEDGQVKNKQSSGDPMEETPTLDSSNMEVDVLASAVSRLSTSDQVPTNVSFGRRHNKGFAFVPRTCRGRGKVDM